MRRRDPRVRAARRQYAAAVSRGEVRRGEEARIYERILAAQPPVTGPAPPSGKVLVDHAALAARLGLPSSATRAEVESALKRRVPPVPAPAAAAADQPRHPSTGRFQPPKETHLQFMQRMFPTIADPKGYATVDQTAFLLGTSPAPTPTVASGRPSGATRPAGDDREHRALMARCYPAVATGTARNGRARIHRFN